VAHEYRLEEGLLSRLGQLLAEAGARRCAVITDANVARLWRGEVEEGLRPLACEWLVLPPGEEHKSLDTARALYDRLLEAGVERHTPVVAFGGGVVGDLAGFVAATLLRGLPFYQVPTTLLAMVDASIGGKVGVDLPQGKNLVGAFYPPRAVLADPRVLSTLPPAEWSAGMAEVIKHAILAGGSLSALLTDLSARPADWPGQVLLEMVRRAAEVKLAVVARDPFEEGERLHLNLGHTFGHALEAAGGYRLLTHGQAVALGLQAALNLSRRMGLLEEDFSGWLETLLERWRLPRRLPAGLRWARLEAALRQDKKRRHGRLNFVLPRRLGQVALARADPLEVRAVLEKMGLEG
jgi:3-dehydroquinate synthase